MPRDHRTFSNAFAAVLQKHRTEKQLSRQALAERAGLHQTYIGLIERGLSNPSLDAAHAIARALELPLSKLIIETESALTRAKPRSE